MHPGVTSGVVRRGAAVRILVLQLPEELPFQAAAMTGSAIVAIDLFALHHELVVVGIREMARLGRSAGNKSERGPRCGHNGQHENPHYLICFFNSFAMSCP